MKLSKRANRHFGHTRVTSINRWSIVVGVFRGRPKVTLFVDQIKKKSKTKRIFFFFSIQNEIFARNSLGVPRSSRVSSGEALPLAGANLDNSFWQIDERECSQLSQVSPGSPLVGLDGVLLRGGRPSLLGEATVSLHSRKRRAGTLRRIVAALKLIVVVPAAAGRLLVIVVRREDVAVARVRAVLGGRVRRGVSALAQAPIRPRMVGPVLLSDRRAHSRAAYVLDVADALDPTVTLPTGRHRPGRQLGRRRRIAPNAAHVLALAGQTSGVRRRRRRGLLAPRTETERPTQGTL